ncbi:uncharacterized protein LOC128387378 [Panonychus citri]|uniref:uncharacterized protein LOC128387378 n=1 Tax=Panonychus citri TaxID=50023 RepID=UPI0023075F94|nr:uncharacterized protein LOC128387378 [Panonychus citri]
MDKSSIKVISTLVIFVILSSSFLIVADAFMGRRDMEMELLLLKLIQNRRQKQQQQQVIPIPIYIPRCRGHHHPPRSESQHYPVYVPIHTHEHHILDSSSHLNFAVSPCSSNSCSLHSTHSSPSSSSSSPNYHQLLQLQESI